MTPTRLPWWWNASLIALGLAMALFRLIPTEADPDLWGHLRFGLDTLGTLGTGSIVRADIYSYLSGLSGDYPWINHEWLAEVIMATAWNAAGAAGIVAVKVAIGLAIAIVVCRHLIARGVPLLGALLMTAYGMAVILPGLRSLRPQAFTYLAFALLLVWMHRASRGHRRMAVAGAAADGGVGQPAWRLRRWAWRPRRVGGDGGPRRARTHPRQRIKQRRSS